jgi:hypothetical protein
MRETQLTAFFHMNSEDDLRDEAIRGWADIIRNHKEQPVNELTPGEVLTWKPGLWTVVKVYPAHPTDRARVYRQSVDIADSDGNVVTVDDLFIATWFMREAS